jgi:hypothetical protein
MGNVRVAALAALAGLAGCSAVTGAVQTVNNVRAGTNAYDAWTMAKDMRSAQPYFSGYDGAVGLASVQSRDGSPDLQAAFADNMVYVLQQSAVASGAPVSACADLAHCGGKHILVVQFREKAPDNALQRLAAGDRVRGVVDFTDAQTGQLVGESRIEAADTYATALQAISVSVRGAMFKSFPPKDSAAAQSRMAAMNQLDPVKPEYKALFKAS